MRLLWLSTDVGRGLVGVERERGVLELDRMLLVVDSPGNNSLEDHARAFANCDPTNNLVLVLVPFAGDVSQDITEEIGNVHSNVVSVLVLMGAHSTIEKESA